LASGSTARGIAQVLRERAAATSSVRTDQHERDVLNGYLQWADGSSFALRSRLTSESLDELVLTRHYWALRAMNGSEARVRGQVATELQERNAALTQAAEDFEAEERHWRSDSPALVLDSNMLVQTTVPFENVDWAQAVGQRNCHVVLPMAVIRQLDRLKLTGPREQVKTAARTALRSIRELVSTPGQRVALGPENRFLQQSTLEVLPEPLGRVRFPTEDEEIVRAAVYLKQLAVCPVQLVTWDSNMAFMAASEGLTVAEISREWERDDGPSTRARRREQPSL